MVTTEAPKRHREAPIQVGFIGRLKEDIERGTAYFEYPGGKVDLSGTTEQVYRRFEEHGFTAEAIGKILFYLWGAVASEAAISFEKIVNSQNQMVRREIGK